MNNKQTTRHFAMAGLFIYSVALCLPPSFAQSSIERVLTSVEQNNRTLRAEGLTQAARRAELRTGLSPDNPFIEYDYMPGRPEGSGVQQQFSLTQALDLPSVYRRRREVARLQQQQTSPQQRIVRQQVLLEAKRLYLELLYHNIRQNDLQTRLRRAISLAAGVREQVRGGTATALDVSKADLARLGLENDLRATAYERQQRTLRLAELNGGQVIEVADTLYPVLPVLPAFAGLNSLIEAADPTLAVVRQQVSIDREQVELSRARTLPRFELGYHYQALLGVRYGGVHAGLTLPLWQQRGTVAASQAALLASQERMTGHRAEHLARTQRLYQQVQLLQTNLMQYQQALATTNTLSLLDTSFRLRQLTVVSYILETTYLYNATDTFRQLERDVQLAMAELLVYQL